MDYKDMSDNDLVNDYKATYQAVEVDECFSLKDMARLEHEGYELERRGFKVEKLLKITKGGILY